MEIKIGDIELSDWTYYDIVADWVRNTSSNKPLGCVMIRKDLFNPNTYYIIFKGTLAYLDPIYQKQGDAIFPLVDIAQQYEVLKDHVDQFLLKMSKMVAFI